MPSRNAENKIIAITLKWLEDPSEFNSRKARAACHDAWMEWFGMPEKFRKDFPGEIRAKRNRA